MATDPNKKYEAIDELYRQADIGVSSETVLKALDPLIERRLGLLLEQLAVAKPELGELLDVRARLIEAWRIRKELKLAGLNGKKALEVLQSVLEIKP